MSYIRPRLCFDCSLQAQFSVAVPDATLPRECFPDILYLLHTPQGGTEVLGVVLLPCSRTTYIHVGALRTTDIRHILYIVASDFDCSLQAQFYHLRPCRRPRLGLLLLSTSRMCSRHSLPPPHPSRGYRGPWSRPASMQSCPRLCLLIRSTAYVHIGVSRHCLHGCRYLGFA